MSRAFISNNILEWARIRAGFSSDALAKYMGISEEKFSKWEAGKGQPTFRQAQKLALKLSIPFGYLFLEEPPKYEPQIADLRTVRSEEINHFTPEFQEVLDDCLVKQNWYREQLLTDGAVPLDFIGKFSLNDDPVIVARDIQEILGLGTNMRSEAQNWQEFLNLVIDKTESAGILVMRNGVVKNKTKSNLSISEFRGFVLSDPIAPLIFINNNDAKSAKIFTLAHELAHLWIGESGITNVNPGRTSGLQPKRTEKFCNIVAAELLVPQSELEQYWNAELELQINLQNMARHFRVSPLVILIRVKNLDLVDDERFLELYPSLSTRRPSPSSGGNSYNTIPVRNSKRFTRTLLESALEGRTLYRDATRLLGLKKWGTVQTLAQKMNIR